MTRSLRSVKKPNMEEASIGTSWLKEEKGERKGQSRKVREKNKKKKKDILKDEGEEGEGEEEEEKKRKIL